MKNKDLLPLISKSQDNDVLVKGYSDDDYLSMLIMRFLSDNTDVEQDVDLGSLSIDFSYAINQLQKAKAVLDAVDKEEYEKRQAQEKEFDVEVVRVGYGFKTIRVRAISQEEANNLALDKAGDHEFSEKSSDYKIAE